MSLLIPSPSLYKELDTFLQPLVKELGILYTRIPNVLYKSSLTFTFKAYVIHYASDSLVIIDLIGFKKLRVVL